MARQRVTVSAPTPAQEPTPVDSRSHGDPVNLTPYIWPTLKMYTTPAERLSWGISEDRSMQINLMRFADHLRTHADYEAAQPAPVVAAPAPNHPVMTMPRWKCRTCGCLWRDNLDGMVSLFDASQKSCATCEHGPTNEETCDIDWFGVVVQPLPIPPVSQSDEKE
jgi:hypothetical protein